MKKDSTVKNFNAFILGNGIKHSLKRTEQVNKKNKGSKSAFHNVLLTHELPKGSPEIPIVQE